MDTPGGGSPFQSKTVTGRLMVLFAPSPYSFYRVKEYDDVEKAKEWCERFAVVPSQQNYLRLVVCDEIKWQDFVGKKSFDVSRNKAHKYMVLCQLLEGLYRMYEFEQIEDTVHHALATRTHLQELRASRQMGLPESVQVFAFTVAGEWNPENKPGAENPFGLSALRWHAARGSNSATYGVWPLGLGSGQIRGRWIRVVATSPSD
jgi:hypothetical protein